MIGVYLFSDAVLSSLVVLTLLALWLQSCGLLRGVVTKEHYHDLGKLTFAFVFFWGYIAFSQYMLIWYANMPEETQFYMLRQIGPWAGVSLALIVVHFVLPFLGLMSKHVKRLLPLFAFWLVWLLVAHAFDLFWLIMPNTVRPDTSVLGPRTLPEPSRRPGVAAVGLPASRRVGASWTPSRAAATGGDRHGGRAADGHGRPLPGQHGVAAAKAPPGAREGPAAERIPEFS